MYNASLRATATPLLLLALSVGSTGCVNSLGDDEAGLDGLEEEADLEGYDDEGADVFGDGGIATTSEALRLSRFQLPFACGSQWRGDTRTNHSLLYAVDFNRGSCNDDRGSLVRAAKAGTVAAVHDWTTSYGRHVIISHGDGYTTLYAHLRGTRVSPGEHVRRGQVIGSLGATGNAGDCSHLHYEMRRGGNDIKAQFNGNQVHYFGERIYTSQNCR
jgi:murein DD-endopeptidase MepM/ murein hydrolase activator NlpD